MRCFYLPLKHYSRYLANLYCRRIHIDDVFNKTELYQNSALVLIDEPLFEEIAVDSFARLIFASEIDKSLVISFLKVGGCWQMIKKEIPESHFGVFPYLVQEKPIEYTVSKKIVSNKFFGKINIIFNNSQQNLIPDETDLQVTLIELKSTDFKGRRFISKDDSDILLELIETDF